MNQKYQVLARRYRPQTFKEVVGQEAVVTTLKNALRFDKVAGAYIFCGPRGTGKTTLARLFAKALNCSNLREGFEPCTECASCLEIARAQSLDVIEIDGASNRGIDDIRQINETVHYVPSHGRFKVYIIDEVHMLTKEAFNALLKTLEEPPERAKFFFATTEPHKVLTTILSRCQRFDLKSHSLAQITAKLEAILADLERSVDQEALYLIATKADGSLRDAESLLDQILCFAEGVVTADLVRASLGLVAQEHLFALDEAFSKGNLAFAFELVEELLATGKELSSFLSQLIDHYRLLSLCKIVGETALSLPAELSARYTQVAHLYTQSQCLYLLDYLLQAEMLLTRSCMPRVTFETILLHLIRSKNRIPVEVLVRRLSELEEKLVASPREEAPPPEEEPPKRDLQPVPFNPQRLSQTQQETPPKHPSHYETLMRFAAVELEGTFKQ